MNFGNKISELIEERRVLREKLEKLKEEIAFFKERCDFFSKEGMPPAIYVESKDFKRNRVHLMSGFWKDKLSGAWEVHGKGQWVEYIPTQHAKKLKEENTKLKDLLTKHAEQKHKNKELYDWYCNETKGE